MTPSDQARLLAAKADEDIHVLSVLLEDRVATDAVWGFHAQQAVEKLLKSLLSQHQIRFPFTHRLLELADSLEDAKYPLPPQFDELLDLTPYAVEFRYSQTPSGPEDSNLDRAKTLRLIAEFRALVEATITP